MMITYYFYILSDYHKIKIKYIYYIDKYIYLYNNINMNSQTNQTNNKDDLVYYNKLNQIV